ncbi:hypothetical protein DFJ77DRAFT_330515 [Powellomyces hirtus]|nr:hypothetical protein DFJ77DRAFT_330515 [Powellomyces hirtus]
MVTPLSFLPYTIAACTSSNEEGNPNQLALSRPTANNKALHSAGWLSERFCSYPQALVFRLASGLCRIRKIEVLVHHYMISTKLEFWVGRNQRDDWDVLKASADTAAGDQSDVKFEHLGFVSLNDGAQVQYKARELKSVHIDAEAEYLKIVVHKCHVNTLNLYNQVGLVAINIFGNVCDTSQFSESLNEQQQILLGLDPSRDSATDAAPHDNSNAALWGLINETSTERRMPVGQSLSFSGCADPAVAKLIVAVTKAKEDAVVDERFHDAKVLKILLEKCKEAGDEVNKLHTTKAKAVSIEDYDTAARMKADIAAITHALHSDLKHCGLNVVSADSTSFARPSNDERAPEDEHGTSTNHSAHSPEHRNRSSSRDPSLPPSPPSSKHASPPKPHDRSAASVPPHTILQSLPWDKGRVSPNLINVQAAREKQVVIEEVPLSQQKHPTVPVHSPPRSASVSDSSVRQSHPEPLPAIPAESPPSHENPGQSPPVSATVSAPSTLPVPPIPKPPQSQQRQESLPLAAAAPRQQNGDREVKRPASPPVPALSKPVDAKPKWYEQEYPDPDAEPIVPKVKKVVKKAPLRPKPVVSRPGALPPTRKSVEQHEASSAPYPIKESSSKSGIKGSETGKQGLPPGFEPPEAIPEHLSTEFALPIEAYGSLIIQCLLGRQFGLREWAMGDLSRSAVCHRG